MSEWKEFFEGRSSSWEEAYKAFFARNKAEAKGELTEIFGPLHCQCPYPYEKTTDNGICRFLGDTDVCTHPSNKPPEPECKHRVYDYFSDVWLYFKDRGDKRCRNCGEKLS